MVSKDFDPEVEVDVAIKTREMEDAIAAFMETNFDGYLRLGDTDLVGLCVLCQDDHSDESGSGPSCPPGDGTSPAHE